MFNAEVLLKLQEIDRGLLGVEKKEKRLAELDGHLQSIGDKSEKLKVKVEQDKEQLGDLKRKTAKFESDFMSMDTKSKEMEEKLYNDVALTPKEMENMQSKLKDLQKQKQTIEEEGLTLLDEVEDLVQMINKYQGRQAEVEKEYRKGKKKLAALADSVAEQKRELVNAGELLHKELSAEVLRAYQDANRRHPGSALAILDDNLCTGCRLELHVSKKQEIAVSDNPELCDNCGRILFLAPKK